MRRKVARGRCCRLARTAGHGTEFRDVRRLQLSGRSFWHLIRSLMPTALIDSSEQTGRSWFKSKLLRFTLAVVVVLAIVCGAIFAFKWPFTRGRMIQRLQSASHAQVDIRNFRSTYFPPGCVADDVVFRKETSRGDRNTAPLLKIARLTITSSYSGLVAHQKRISKIIADGVHIVIPAGGTQFSSGGSADRESLLIDEFEARDGILEFASRKPGGKALSLAIHQASFRNISSHRTIPFALSMRLPMPAAELAARGWIGPWQDQEGTVRSTPVSGSCDLEHGNLSVFESLGGTIESHVTFSGTLARVAIAGTTNSPDFEVKASRHRLPLNTQFRGTVDLANGDVLLPSLSAKLGNTHLTAQARVTGHPKKTVELRVDKGEGEVQDLILLFSKAPRSPINGPIEFQTFIVLPPEQRPFKQRVQLAGDFRIDPARFTSANTQGHVDQLSERARGEKDKDGASYQEVLSNLRGHVTVRDGVSRFSTISFSVPGATARMHGAYNLVNDRVNFQGKMRMQATVSQATTGVKSFFLKILDPFFKKKKSGAELPVSMTGTYGHTHFAAGLK